MSVVYRVTCMLNTVGINYTFVVFLGHVCYLEICKVYGVRKAIVLIYSRSYS